MELGDICEMIVDCEHKTAPTQESGYPSIRTPNIGRGYFLLDNVNRVSDETYRLWTRRSVPKAGDVIMAREAPVGNVAMIPNGLQPCLGQRTVLLRCDTSKVSPRYLVYLLIGPDVQATIHGMTNGVTVPHLNMEDIHTLPLPELPPLPTQRKIAAILSAYDDLIENNTRRIKILEEIAQAIYREWFVHFRFPGHEAVRMVDSGTELGIVPEGWEISQLANIVSNIRETTSPGIHLSNRKYLPINLITSKSLAIRDYEPWENAKSSLILFEESDLLFGAMRPYLYKVAIAPFAGVTRSTCFVLRPMDEYLFSYAAMTVFKESTIEYADKHSKGTTIPYAAWEGSLADMSILLPPKQLLIKFNTTVEPILDFIKPSLVRQENLRNTRDLLLPRLVRGELDVSELNISTDGM